MAVSFVQNQQNSNQSGQKSKTSPLGTGQQPAPPTNSGSDPSSAAAAGPGEPRSLPRTETGQSGQLPDYESLTEVDFCKVSYCLSTLLASGTNFLKDLIPFKPSQPGPAMIRCSKLVDTYEIWLIISKSLKVLLSKTLNVFFEAPEAARANLSQIQDHSKRPGPRATISTFLCQSV